MNKESSSMQAASTHTRVGGGQAEPDRENSRPATPEARPDKDAKPSRRPPDSIPDLMPGVDPQQTPGIDRTPAEGD